MKSTIPPRGPNQPTFAPGLIQAVAEVLGQTDPPGLTNGDIAMLLSQASIEYDQGHGNKRTNLYASLLNAQNASGEGRIIEEVVNLAMDPGRYGPDKADQYAQLRDQLNERLVLHKLEINKKNRMGVAPIKAESHAEAAHLAGTLHSELRRRDTHEELLRYCSEELVNKSLFHAICEAAKSLPDRVRKETGLAGDGDALYAQTFGTKQVPPMICINDYNSDSDLSEHKGFKTLLLGIHGHFRNPRVHDSRINRDEQIIDFYDAFGLFSYAHRRLDRACQNPDYT